MFHHPSGFSTEVVGVSHSALSQISRSTSTVPSSSPTAGVTVKLVIVGGSVSTKSAEAQAEADSPTRSSAEKQKA